MARKCKNRLVERLPSCTKFTGQNDDLCSVNLTVDEYETIRFMDYLNLSQAEAAKRMGIARTTLQAIYDNARKKIAQFIVIGSTLNISGGNYEIKQNTDTGSLKNNHTGDIEGEKIIMKIALTYENGEIFQHFGKSENLEVVTIENGKVVKDEVLSTNGQGHGALIGLLESLNVDALICGGIGQGAINLLSQRGIKLYAGISGNTKDAVASFIANTLPTNSESSCHHHDHEEGHECHCEDHEEGHEHHCHCHDHE